MKNIQTITTLLFIGSFLTMFLFGFTIYHQKRLFVPAPPEYSFACGTTDYAQDKRVADTPTAVAGAAIFNANCRACHRMQHKLVGPPLLGVFDRRDSVWIRTLITDIDILIKRNDIQIQQLRKEYTYTDHTRFTSMSREDMDNLLIYLKDSGKQMH